MVKFRPSGRASIARRLPTAEGGGGCRSAAMGRPGLLAALVGLALVASTPGPGAGLFAAAQAAEGAPPGPSQDGAVPPEYLTTPESLVEGKRLFVIHCTTCHGLFGGGGLGPNLTDDETIHGGRYADMLGVVMFGVQGTGMPRWIGLLGPERVSQAAAYVFTLKGTRKEPPGDKKRTIRFSVVMLAPAAALLPR